LAMREALVLSLGNSEERLVRKRREWIVPPKSLTENVDYTHQDFIAKIRSDYESHRDIDYSLEGAGASQKPFHVFVVDHKTGLIRVTKVLDREKIAMYNLSGIATYKDGTYAEKKIDIRIKVVDDNDNFPVFGVIQPVGVFELSPAGTSVVKINATDADEPGNENSQIAYTIVNQNPSHDMFYITNDGTIHVKKPTLDREIEDRYILTLKGQDLNGKPEGNTGFGNVTINILDVNDNPPTLEKEMYEGSIEENMEGVEVMRLKAKDLDMKNTANWDVVFDIVKGNEAGHFSIKTDPETNEGILMLETAVDYEDLKDLDLGINVRNKAPPYNGSGASGASMHFGGAGGGAGSGGGGGGSGWSGGSSWQSGNKIKTYPVKISVKNQPEGPAFDPKVKAIPISEGGHSINIKDVIAHYPAIDGDTGKPAENVRYAKGSDPDNWLTIDPETAEIKLNKIPDRESKFLVNGTIKHFFLHYSHYTDNMPAKTATGTIAIQVKDFNDHCPILTSKDHSMCTTADSVIVVAQDEDYFPNGPPFDFFIVPEGTEGKWQVERLNDTAAILRAQESIWPGFYEVEFLVKDEQGHACPEPQKVKVQICTCEDGVLCGKRGANGKTSKVATLGPASIGLLLLGLLLLLLIPLLLLFCHCGGAGGLPGGFTEMPFDTKPHLFNYHTEGQGENTVGIGMAGITSAVAPKAALDYQKSVTSMDGMNGAIYRGGFSSGQGEGSWGIMNKTTGNGLFSEFHDRESTVGRGVFGGMALPDNFLKQYYSQVISGNENMGVKDGLLVYDYEGQGSSAGSVGCCSLLESENDLHFLDDLGPKFKTLAEVCRGKKIQTEVKTVLTPLPSASINNQRINSVKEEIAHQGQMILLQQQQQQQQPVYLATTPVLQPMHYIVQPQVQNTVMIAKAPATNLQGMILLNGTQNRPAQGVVVQGQTVLSNQQSRGPGMMLVETSGIQGGSSNLIHTGNLSVPQTVMVVEGKVPAASMKVRKGNHAVLHKGTQNPGVLAGSQRVLVVGGPVRTEGQLVQETGGRTQQKDTSGSQRVLYSNGKTSVGPQSNMVASATTTVSKTPIPHKIVMQETREIH
uniref:Cadherin domain-containing protein n=1 Tax=Mola mola TaxID=94237 RepID=A0A3Q3WQK7_MOLML